MMDWRMVVSWLVRHRVPMLSLLSSGKFSLQSSLVLALVEC